MNKDLREVRKKVMQKCIPSKGTANAKVLDKECIWLVQENSKENQIARAEWEGRCASR